MGKHLWRVGNAHAAKAHGAALTVAVHIVAHAGADRWNRRFVAQQVEIFRAGNLHVGGLALYDAHFKTKGLKQRGIVGHGKPGLKRMGVGVQQGLKLKTLRSLHRSKPIAWQCSGNAAIFNGFDGICDGNCGYDASRALRKLLAYAAHQRWRKKGAGGIVHKHACGPHRQCRKA